MNDSIRYSTTITLCLKLTPLQIFRCIHMHIYASYILYIHFFLYISLPRHMDLIYEAVCVAPRTALDSESNTAQHVYCKSNYYSPPLNSGADPQRPKAIMKPAEGLREKHTEKEQERRGEIGQRVNFLPVSQCHSSWVFRSLFQPPKN